MLQDRCSQRMVAHSAWGRACNCYGYSCGHALRHEVAAAMALSEDDRLREEDPFTGQAVEGIPTHVIGNRSRFQSI